MKRAAILGSLAILFLATASYAPCWYPEWTHIDFYQVHTGTCCNPPRGYEIWSLDGTCDTDCNGNTYCEGDTEIRWQTYTQSQSGFCDAVCE